MSFQNKAPGMLNDIGALTDGNTEGAGTSLRIEKKPTHQFFTNDSEDSNKKQTHDVQSFSTNTTDFQSVISVHSSDDDSNAPEPLGNEAISANAGTRGSSISLSRNSPNTGEDNNISSAKGKKPVNRMGNTNNEVNEDTPKMSNWNSFPANVRVLLSTGLLEGVPVKYISSSREKKTLRGVIEGYGYLCGCNNCNLTKKVSACEFERHAAVCKTRHPNDHIYFESGKTIHGAVLELKKTPLNMFREAIQNIIGSSITPEKFQRWIDNLKVAKPFSSADSSDVPPGFRPHSLKPNSNERP